MREWEIKKDNLGYYLYDPKQRSPFCFYSKGNYVKYWKTKKGIEKFLDKLRSE